MGDGVVVKAQVHAGGRGKAGGVKLAKDPKEARAHAEQILGMQIKGLTVEKVLVVPTSAIASESYVGVIVDRASERAVVMVSPAGGVDIEEVAAKTPEQIFKQSVDPKYGLLPHQAMSLAFNLYDDIKQVRQAAKIMQQLYQAFLNAGASLAEINPLITTPGGEVVALDAKIGVDDNELERRPNTLVKYYGGEPANFLDIGGSSSPEKVITALEIITSDPNVKAILFNIFGGITRCDDVANGIVAATGQTKLNVPIVIRLTGTNEDLAIEILKQAGFEALTDMDEAVQQAVKLAQEAA
jgi:succinyl-CoA synthetase beta subunit